MTSDFINRLIALSGKTQKDFAEWVDVSPSTVAKWRKGLSEPAFHNQKAIRIIFREEIKLLK